MSDFRIYTDLPRMMPSATPLRGSPSPADGETGSFGNVLKEAVNEVNKLEKTSQEELQKYLHQESDLHTVMMALEKADMSFQMMMQVRNKVVQAYQEIMRTQV